MKTEFDVMSVADLCLDILVSGPQKPEFGQVELLVDDYMLDLGGSVGIFASQFSKLGGSVALLGKVGSDTAGEFVLRRLKQTGVDTRYIIVSQNEKTPMGLNLSCHGDRAMLTYLGVMNSNTKEIFDRALIGLFKHWHIGGYFLMQNLIPAWLDWIRLLHSRNISISLDTNWDPSGDWENIWELLPWINVFLPNEAEAHAITGDKDLNGAGRKLAEKCTLVVIKTGDKGASVFQGTKRDDYSIPDAFLQGLRIKDTTGAGDNFDAGFIRCWLLKKPVSTCIECAFSCAISSLKSMGGIEGQIVIKHIE